MNINEDLTHDQNNHPSSKETEPLLLNPTPSSSQLQQEKSELYGYFHLIMSCFGFSSSALLVRISIIKYEMYPTQCLFIRAVIQTLLSSLYILSALNIHDIRSSLTVRQWKLLSFRGIMGSVGIACLYAALQRLPVADTITICIICPIMTMFISNVVLAEPITIIDVIASVVSFIGIILVVKPGLGVDYFTKSNRIVGACFAFAAACLAACAYVIVRYLGRRIHFMLSTFSLGFFSLFVGVFLGGVMGPQQVIQKKEGMLIAVLASIFAFAGQCGLNLGLQHCPAGPGVLLRSLDVPIAYILGLLFLGEKPTWLTFTGSVMVLVGAGLVGLRKLMQ